jgi:hypothetical protein
MTSAAPRFGTPRRCCPCSSITQSCLARGKYALETMRDREGASGRRSVLLRSVRSDKADPDRCLANVRRELSWPNQRPADCREQERRQAKVASRLGEPGDRRSRYPLRTNRLQQACASARADPIPGLRGHEGVTPRCSVRAAVVINTHPFPRAETCSSAVSTRQRGSMRRR